MLCDRSSHDLISHSFVEAFHRSAASSGHTSYSLTATSVVLIISPHCVVARPYSCKVSSKTKPVEAA